MNKLASKLLSWFLGWTRGLANSVLSAANGTESSFFSWLCKHWFFIFIVMLVLGVVADWVFYILRWHPQKVWQSFIHRLFMGKDEKEALNRFEKGYERGIEASVMDDVIPGIAENAPQNQGYDAYELIQPTQQSMEEKPSAPVRRRRSGRRKKRHFAWLHLQESDEEQYRLDDAYNEAVYPVPMMHRQDAEADYLNQVDRNELK